MSNANDSLNLDKRKICSGQYDAPLPSDGGLNYMNKLGL